MFAFGEIVLARFPFTDLSGDKRRPALVVSKASGSGDVILCFIMSIPRSGPGMVVIDPDRSNGLKQRSIVRFDKIATLSDSLVAGKLGVASADWLRFQGRAFHGVFGFPIGDEGAKGL